MPDASGRIPPVFIPAEKWERVFGPKEAPRLNVKHWHEFKPTGTCSGYRHGMDSRCECGAQRFTGSVGDRMALEYIPRPRA